MVNTSDPARDYARPRRLFLVESRLPFGPADPEYFIAWQENPDLLWVNAGFSQALNPQVSRMRREGREDVDEVSIVPELLTTRDFAPRNSLARAWDVTELVGHFHPRIQRPTIVQRRVCTDPRPSPAAHGLSAQMTASVSVAQLLFDELDEVLTSVEPTGEQLDVFGQRLRNLLLTACTEVESGLKRVLAANRPEAHEPSMRDYVDLALPMRLNEWAVVLVRSAASLQFVPFASWATEPRRSPSWYRAYNATKHDRESNLHVATLGNVLSALAAVYVLLVAQFGVAAVERLRHRPFEVVNEPCWEPQECYVLSPFQEPEFAPRDVFPASD